VSGEPREEVGPYIVYEQLGSGGMATVHRAEQRGIAGFRRVVALKRLHANVAADPELLRSFIHEARLASYLKHTNVAQTHDLGKVGETYFIAMEFVAGPTLAQLMRQCANAVGPIPLGIVLSILIQICDALDHAHNLCDESGRSLGIIHRDVSPSNVIVSNSGTVKLIDFGIAKASNSDVRTQTGMIKGKFGYIAPEYLTGQLDPRGDLFGVGVIAHELVTGRPLFLGRNDFDTLNRLREMPIPQPTRPGEEVPPDLEDIVMTALQRDPELRWQSAAAMRTALHNALRTVGVVTGPQVVEWVEWAFTQMPRPESTELRHVMDELDDPSVMFESYPASASGLISPFGASTPDPTVPPPLPAGFAPGASPPSGFAPDELAPPPYASDSMFPPTSPGFAPAALRRAARAPEMLPPEGLPPEGLPPEELPPETVPPEELPPETLPLSAFAPEVLPPSAFTEPVPPPVPPPHLASAPPPGPPVDPAVKLAAAMLAPALPVPVSAPKLVSAPQLPSGRSKALSTPPVTATRDKSPSVAPPPRGKSPSVPPPRPSVAGAGKPPPVPPAGRAHSPSVPPPIPGSPGASKPPPAGRASASGSKPPPVPRPDADSLGATDPHLPRFDSFDTTDPVSHGTELDPTDPVPRESGSLASFSATPSRSRSLEELAGLPSPPWAMGSNDAAETAPRRRSRASLPNTRPSQGAMESGSAAATGAAAVAPAMSGAGAPAGVGPAAKDGPRASPSKEAKAARKEGKKEPGKKEPKKEAREPKKEARKAPSPKQAPPEPDDEADPAGGRWWLVLLLLLLAAIGAAVGAYYLDFNLAR
jgi:serine/threonine protein kinase